MTMRLVAERALPDGYDYTDTGCKYSPSCLTCPLSQCREERYSGAEGRERRDEMVWCWRLGGMGVRQIANALKVSTRTVHRILQAGKPENSPLDEARMMNPSSGSAAVALRSIYKQRPPIPQLRPGLANSVALYERG